MNHHPHAAPTLSSRPAAERASVTAGTLAASIRRSEWVLCLFFAYAAVLALFAPVAPSTRVRVVALNALILAGYATLVLAENAARNGRVLNMARDWLPLALTLFAYHEMGWFALPLVAHPLESRWVVWDRAILRGFARQAIESLGPVLPAILDAAYFLVYALGPLAVAMLYIYRRRARADRFLFLFTTGVLLCYAQFPFWPSEPPRTVFPGEDLPSYLTVFRRWNLSLLETGGIHTSVFPSAHVAAGFCAAAGMWSCLSEHKWVGRLFAAAAVVIAIATVYGRYHYLVDVFAGLLMTGVALVLTRLLAARPNRNTP